GTVNPPCGLLSMMFEPASAVQLSASLVTNTVAIQHCVSSGTGSATSCEPFAFLMASRPKRILLLPSGTWWWPLLGTVVTMVRTAVRIGTPSVSTGRTPSRNDSSGASGEAARVTARAWVKLPLAPAQFSLVVMDAPLAVGAVAANVGLA